MKYKLAIFDMDDTLLAGRTIYAIADRKGFRDKVDEILSRRIINYEKTILIARLLRGTGVEEFLEIFRSIPLNPNVPEVIDVLRDEGMRVGIV
ncbi:MAG TPA: hypothetical protein ENF43_04255, partial [Thermoplasmatales archaeon]|nr:hypothetical protein [Thermoplasmatales archaeon]